MASLDAPEVVSLKNSYQSAFSHYLAGFVYEALGEKDLAAPGASRSAASWAGVRPVSPDGIPFLGILPGVCFLIAATGHAMMGLSLGPISGKLVAETLADQKTSINIQALSPDRYA